MTDDEFFALFRQQRLVFTRYAARLLRGNGGNPYTATVEGESIVNLVMAQYYNAGEHRDPDADHEAFIRRRIQQRVIDEVRRQLSKTRKPPQPLLSLDAPIPGDDDGDGDFLPQPADEFSGDAQLEADLTDRLSNLPDNERRAAMAKDQGRTNKEIGKQLGVSDETARQAAIRAGQALRDDQ